MTNTNQPADFLIVPLAEGGEYVRLDRLTDGRVMCCICFEYCARDQLNPVAGGVEDVCKGCARIEAAVAEAPGTACRAAHDPGWGGDVQVCTRPHGHGGSHRDDRAFGGAQ
ncbi:hypothetical protein [Streptomyces alboviridis]|uniref:hypothetical protein n=1 Tax=Streptomyces alboviridis TaxID=67269 RepID=UPI0005158397|nr:hypothetical protein [Streptomyces alboviridis]